MRYVPFPPFQFMRVPAYCWSTLSMLISPAPSQKECQEGNPVLSDGLRCQRYRYVLITPYGGPMAALTFDRPYDLREHPLPATGPRGQGRRRCGQCPSRGGCPHQAQDSWYVLDQLTTPVTYSRLELDLDDEGSRVSLTIVDTPGFGDQIDNEARHVTSTSPHKDAN